MTLKLKDARFLTTKETAELLKKNIITIRRKIRSNQINAIVLSDRVYRIDSREIIRVQERPNINFEEYSLSEILRDKLTKIKGVYTKYNLESDYFENIIKYHDLLNWDNNLLADISKYTGVINLFTSEECHGACVFCYRKDTNKLENISSEDLVKRIKALSSDENITKKYKYFRFLDDDFLAAKDRNIELLNTIHEVTKGSIQLYELTFSIRSIYKQFELEGINKVIDSIKQLKLKRVILGTDGYNDIDLKYLQKGYSFSKAEETIRILSKNKIPTLMYAILSTPVTTASSLYQSLQNMIRLISYGNIYIGQYIAPLIYLQKGNLRLESKIIDEDLKFIEIDTLTQGEVSNVEKSYKNARLYPRDRLSRLIVKSYLHISMEDSMHIVPIMKRYFKFLAMELNRIDSFIMNSDRIKKGLISSRRKHLKLKEIAETKWDSLQSTHQNDIDLANYILKQRRIISDIENMIEQIKLNKLTNQKTEYLNIYGSYVSFIRELPTNSSPDSLFFSIMSMIEEPISTFKQYYKEYENLG